MHLLERLLLCCAAVAVAPTASATVLVSNIGEPRRATTTIDGGFWAAQGFFNDGSASTLTSIRTVLGDATGIPNAFAELRQGSTLGAVVASFALPSLAGPSSARTLAPLGVVSLAPNETYYLIMGINGPGSFGWSYAEGNAFIGTGGFVNYEYSTDQGVSWVNFGGDNPYLLEVNVMAGAVPEPAAWLLMIAGLGATGAAMRKRRARLRFAF